MYTIDDKVLLKYEHNCGHRKGTAMICRGIVMLVTLLVVFVHTGCEEPVSGSSPMVEDTSVLVSDFSGGGGGVRILARITRDDGSVTVSNPIVGLEGTVYVVAGTMLYALDTEGTLRGTLVLSGTITEDITSTAGARERWRYIHSERGDSLWHRRRQDSTRQFEISDTIATGLAISRSGVVYVGTDNGKLYAIDVDVERKKYRTGKAIVSSPAVGMDGTIYVGSDDGGVYVLGSDGGKKWWYETKGAVRSSPAIGLDGTIYVGSGDSKVYALGSDGRKKWRYATRGAVRSSSAIGLDGTIYVGSDDSKVYALGTDGTLKWTYETRGQVRSSPAVGNIGGEERIYVGSNSPDNHLYVLDSEGKELWRWDLLGGWYRRRR